MKIALLLAMFTPYILVLLGKLEPTLDTNIVAWMWLTISPLYMLATAGVAYREGKGYETLLEKSL